MSRSVSFTRREALKLAAATALAGTGLPPFAWAAGRSGLHGLSIFGDLKYQPGFNSNGITATPDGKGLLVVQSNTGGLFHVTWTGKTRRVNLHGDSLRQGDGLLLRGRTMYAVEGHDNAVAVLRLNAAGTDGHVVRRVTDRRFDVPSTVAAFGSRIYLPNARFNTTPTPTTPYWAIAIPRP